MALKLLCQFVDLMLPLDRPFICYNKHPKLYVFVLLIITMHFSIAYIPVAGTSSLNQLLSIGLPSLVPIDDI